MPSEQTVPGDHIWSAARQYTTVPLAQKWSVFLGREMLQAFGHALVGECFPTPVNDGKHIVVTTDQGVVACLDMTGKIKWIAGTDYFGGGMGNVGSSPVLADGKVIFNMNSKTYAYDLASGKKIWTAGEFGDKHVNGHAVYSSPIITHLDGTLVVIDRDAVYARDAYYLYCIGN